MAASPYSVVRQRSQQRHMRLVALGYSDYSAYLRSPHWKATKARYRASDQPQDCICGATEGLQLHHMTYVRVGAEELTDLTPLCESCHQMIHVLERRGDIGLDFAGFVNERRAARYALAQRPLNARRMADHNVPENHWRIQRRILTSIVRAHRQACIQAIREGRDWRQVFRETTERLT